MFRAGPTTSCRFALTLFVTSLLLAGLAAAQTPTDFGDAPDPTYPTLLASDGARHARVPGSRVFLGSCVDFEADGQPSAVATGDDVAVGSPVSGTCAAGDDEDGVVFTGDRIAGGEIRFDVGASDACTLSAFVDWNADGDWGEANENLFPGGQLLAPGTNSLSATIPADAAIGTTFARFRCTSGGAVGPTGAASDGEVEDYETDVAAPIDFGDTPFPFPTTSSANGARHLLAPRRPFLGACVDAETDGQPSTDVDGDDNAVSPARFGTCGPGGDDEDGVVFTSAIVAGQTATVDVTASAPCTLSAWIDFNRNGFWIEGNNNLFPSGQALSAGVNSLSFSVPAGASAGVAQARFRCTTDGAVNFTGQASDGEVEDYVVTIGEAVDYGDAPDPTFPTLAASSGASHVIGGSVFLGACVDPEADGQPAAGALGDDTAAGSPTFGSCATGGDDEDGVSFLTALVPGENGTVRVIANAACTLSAWIDWSRDGDWSDAGEDLFPGGQALTAGTNDLALSVPANARGGQTFSRFRCTTDGAVTTTGQASDGEVEDHAVSIVPLDYGDAPDPTYPSLFASGGARHRLGSNTFLGACVDAEADGQPTAAASGDDLAATSPAFGSCGSGDDEDGVTFPGAISAGQIADVTVTASSPCTLSAWIDFDQDGSWTGMGENLFPGGQPLAAGPNDLSFSVPASAASGATYARFRCTTDGAVGASGLAGDGEVEDYRVSIGALRDFGDAPAPFPSLLADDGARHVLGGSVFLGFCSDAEGDGQPSAGSDGDDVAAGSPVFGPCAGGDDEDGVSLPNVLVPGTTASVNVRASEPCTLSAWIDFDQSGDWSGAGESLFPGGQAVAAGPNALGFTVPAGARPGTAATRFRCTTDGAVGFTGEASDGEVEDHPVAIASLDLGDAPDPSYPTLIASNGARHVIAPETTVFLGTCVDRELDGQPSAGADGDDLGVGTAEGTCVGDDDEDGVAFTTPLVAGGDAVIEVTANDVCTLSAWIDWNADGDWADLGESLFPGGEPLAATVNVLTVEVPESAVPGDTAARFRCATAGPVSPSGPAADGEVEDYLVTVLPATDFGDAPDPTFPTLLASGGASHTLDGELFLGACVDAEADGQPTAAADGDDTAGGAPVFGSCVRGDDEDGVVFTSLLLAGSTATVDVTASAACTLSAWIDFSGDGDWADGGEDLFAGGQALAAGTTSLSFAVPAGAVDGDTYARFRCTTDGPVGFAGPASDGEVEDYRIPIGPATDFGDAPDPSFPTLAASSGASHLLGSGVYLGACVDAEADGQPDAAATGDDFAAGNPVFGTCSSADDEDGVRFTSTIVGNSTVDLEVTASAPCTLSAWIDFGRDGTWTEAEDEIFPGGQALAAGVNMLSFSAPAGVTPGASMSRFRCTSGGAVPFTGQASDGEVEDHVVVLGEALDFGDAADPPYPTLLASNGARHVLGAGVYLGACVDAEADGQPSAAADGDDMATGNPVFGTCAVAGDDEDGVTFTSPLIAGETTTVDVVASAPCTLSAWIDFGGDGSWAEVGDDIFPGGQALAAGTNSLSFPVPEDEIASPVNARFRCTTDGVVAPTGQASDGEVEDYQVAAAAAAADLTITKMDAEDPVAAGTQLTYTVEVFNNGPDVAQGVVVTDMLPAGVSFVSTSGCAEDPAGLPSCSLGTLAVETSASFTITVDVASSILGTITNTASVSASTLLINTGDDTASEDTTVIAEADLGISKSDSPDPVIAGQTLTYTVTVTSAGPSDAQGVVVTDTLPAGVTLVSTSGCAEDPNGVPTCTLGTIAAGGSAQYTITVTVDSDTLGTITNTATVASDAADPNSANDTATEDTTVTAEADLGVTKIDSQDPIGSGQTLTYTIEVSNAGPSAAINVEVTDTLPAGVTFVSTSGCLNDPSGVPVCQLGTIAAGGSAQYTIDVTVDASTPSGTITNTATVSSDAVDPVSANDTATEDTTVDGDPPTVTNVDSVLGTGDGELAACEEARVAISQLLVTFSEPVRDPPGNSDPDDVTNPDNYLLVAAGPDADFTTTACGGPTGDDEPITIAGVGYDAMSRVATLDLASAPLGDSLYRLLVCGSTSIQDESGNRLDGDGNGTGGDDFVRNFRVERTNLLTNGHFDCTIDGWVTVSTLPAEIAWSPEDRDDSSVSGSAGITNLSASTDFSIGQCVPLPAGETCTFRGRLRIDAAPGVSLSQLLACEQFAEPACGGASLGTDAIVALGGDTGGTWSPLVLATSAPAGTQSALCSLSLRSATGEDFSAFFDAARLTCDGELIFADGFESGDTSAWSATVP